MTMAPSLPTGTQIKLIHVYDLLLLRIVFFFFNSTNFYQKVIIKYKYWDTFRAKMKSCTYTICIKGIM